MKIFTNDGLRRIGDRTVEKEGIEMLDLIAQNVTTNIRDLEGAFTRVHATSQLLGSPMNKDLAKMVLTDIFNNTKMKEITPELIKKEVAKYFGVKISDMEGEKRAKNIAYPRQVAIYLIRENTNYSLPQIGKLFGGRDHTTVMHAYNKITKKVSEDPFFNAEINKIIKLIKQE